MSGIPFAGLAFERPSDYPTGSWPWYCLRLAEKTFGEFHAGVAYACWRRGRSILACERMHRILWA